MNNDFYLYSNTRFQPFGLTHNPIMGNSLIGAQMMNASMYKNIHSLKTQMPTDVLELFKANQIGFLKPIKKRKCRSLDPISFATTNIIEKFPDFHTFEQKPLIQSHQMKKNKYQQEKRQQAKQKLEVQIQKWNPFQDPNISNDPYKTLIVSRLNFKTNQKSLKLQFQKYGIVKSVRIIKNKQGKSEGYGFVQYDKKQDFINAYKTANLRRIDGKRIIVDFEKGRSILMWRPRRLGGGQGDLRLTKQQIAHRQRLATFRNEIKQSKKKQKQGEKVKVSRSRSRSKSKQRKQRKQKRERERKDYEYEKYDKIERYHDRYERHDNRYDQGRHIKKQKVEHMEIEVVSKQKKQKKEKKEKSRSRKKDKKQRKEKKEKKQYISMNVPVDEFK